MAQQPPPVEVKTTGVKHDHGEKVPSRKTPIAPGAPRVPDRPAVDHDD